MNALRASWLAAKFFGYRGAITSAVGATITLGAILIDGEGNGVMAGSFGACTASMYIMQADSALHPTMLSTVSIVEENFVLTPTTEAELYNAAGFNEEDFFIYALRRINNGQTAELIRVESDGTTNVVPSVQLPYSVSAEVGPDQMMYIYTGGRLFRLDLKNPSQSNALQGAALEPALSGTDGNMPDIAYHQGFLYGVAVDSMLLIKMDLSSAVWSEVSWNGNVPNVSGSINAKKYDVRVDSNPKGNNPTAGFGAMFGGSNGVYGNNNGGGFCKFDLETGLSQYLGAAAPSGQNDGAKCYSTNLTLPSNIKVNKESFPDGDNPQPAFAPGKKTQYRIVVENHGKFAFPEIQISDPLPPGITNATWRCEQSEVDCSPVSGTGPLNSVVSISARENDTDPPITISFIVEIDVPSDYTDPLVNTVTMELPPLASQSTDGPITASVTKIPALLTVEKVGRWIDTDKSNIANVNDHIEYTFTVTNNGQVPVTDVRIVDALVATEPASVPSLAPGEVAVFTANYVVTQEDIDNAMTENTASAIGTLPTGVETESPPSVSQVQFPPAPEVATEKSGQFLDDLVANEFPDEGEHLEFSVTVKNAGNVTMVAYPPIDPGPTLNGKPMSGVLSAFSPDLHMIPPGQEAVFTALYTLTNEDITEGAGLLDALQNTVETPVQTLKEYREGKQAPPFPLEEPNVLTLPGYAIDKQAQFATVTRGQLVPYVITIRPVDVSGKAMLVDQLPPGFSYVPGSARVAGSPVEPRFEGRLLTIDLDVEPDKDTRVEYTLAVTGTVPLGTFKNTAQIYQLGQILKPVSRRAEADVDVIPDHVFDCGDIIGSVFDDKNRNGYQDPGEEGIPHARIASLNGSLTTTDSHGRFNVACADLTEGRIGKTYLLKLDPRSLPTGYRILSENPRSVRLTAGKVSKLGFAASIGRVVRLDIDDQAFLPGEVNLQPQWQDRLAKVVDLLQSAPTIFRIVYKTADTSQAIHVQRSKSVKENLSREWKVKTNNYHLEIESNIMFANK